MSERDKSLSGSKFGRGSNIGFSGLKSKQLVQSHLRSIMPSLRGGKAESDIKYLRIRVQDNLEYEKQLQKKLKPLLDQFCGEYYDYKIFKNTQQILNQEITQQDLFYLFVKEQLSAWGQKFARQEQKQSDGKKSISIVQFLKRHKYDQKVQQRNKVIQKNRRDPNDKLIYYINSDDNYMEEMRNGLIDDMDAKLKNKLLREGDRVKTWALANKFKQKKNKRERLYIYIQSSIIDKVASLYKRFRKKNGFKWTQISKFSSFQELLTNIKKRQDELMQQVNLVSQISINPVSKIFDKTQSGIKSMSMIGGSAFVPGKSVKNIIHDKSQPGLRSFDKNFIIHSADFEEHEKIYQYIMGQKDNNWQRVIYEDKNFPKMDLLVKQIEQNEKEGENDQYMKIINAKTLYVITYEGDSDTDATNNSLPNNFNNRYLLGYNNDEELLTMLNQYARNDQNFTIVILYQQGGSQDSIVNAFIQKNQLSEDNMLVLYKVANDLNGSLSMNSKVSINDEKDVDRYLRAVMEDRDRNFDPFDCYADNYVYILHRYDKEHLLDQELRQRIGESARLKKATYQDSNYLQAFLKGLERGGDHSIILTEDNNLRQAQEVAKKFNKASIMNVTERKNVKDEIKVMAWGPYNSIKQAIKGIHEKLRVVQRKQYKKVNNEIWLQNSIPRKMPKYIPWKQGNNITVKISSQQNHPDSEVMQQNLNHYFKQQIRIQNYFKPDEIRLVNKAEQPLTFIICRDNEEELNYMKSIAKQQRDDLRQEYILYTDNPAKYDKVLFGNDKYERFRFISNSWKKIQEYIIGLYQDLRGIKNQQNDTIYEDELIHVFYHPRDINLVKSFNDGYKNSKVFPNIRFHQISQLQWIALEQSPHHLYYILVDEISGNFMSMDALKHIQSVKGVLQSRRVAPKKIKMLVISKKTGAMRDQYIQGTFEGSQQALTYISNTNVKKIKSDIVKPHIIIDKGSSDWYYFLQKNADRNRYFYHYVDNNQEALKLIQRVRANQVGSVFWYLTPNQKDLAKFLESSNNIQQGIRIYGLFHGSQPAGVSPTKLIFTNPSRDEIQSFILNSHKRSQTIFSPESLRKRNPILAMSRQNKDRIPIRPSELKKWKQDIGGEQYYFDNIADLKNIPQDRNIFLLTDIQEDKNFRKLQDNWPNVWRIIFDTNEGEREKGHSLHNFFPNTKEAYYGFYPAEIGHYLRYLRYNIKNPPQKLRAKYTGQLTNVYIEKDLYLSQQQMARLLKNNHSIINLWSFDNNKSSIDNAINHSMLFPNYNNVFILSKSSEEILDQHPNKNRVNYIVYDEGFRGLPLKQSATLMRTDEKPQYTTYLFNLPQKRYDRALNNRGDQIKLMYLNNGKLENEINELRQINKRNNNFTLAPYQSINDLAQIRQKVIVLVDPNSYIAHTNNLKFRENITYFILGSDNSKTLIPDPNRSQYFITKQSRQLSAYFNNLKRLANVPSPLKFPNFNIPGMVKNSQNTKFSRPLAFKSGLDITKIKILPPFNIPVAVSAPPPPPPTKLNINLINLIDAPKKQILAAPSALSSDMPMQPLKLEQYYKQKMTKNIYTKVEQVIEKPIVVTSPPLTLKLDNPPGVMQDRFNSKPDLVETVPKQLGKPAPKQRQRTLALVHPDNKQFRQIIRVLQANLYPKSFSKVQTFPYNSDYNFESLARNEEKFRGFDRTVIFITPRMRRYADQLKSLQAKLKGNLQYFIFDDYFDKTYSNFRQFLQPYTINNQQIPYINREDPRFWLQTNNYNVMVPVSKKKKYNSVKGQNISVLPYTSAEDIENQLHRSEQFVIIVCDKKDYHQFKKFPKRSPRCIIVIEDTEQLKEDEVPLMRYPKKVLYYGPDALHYLSKIRIPSKTGPYNPQAMKVLFFNRNSPAQQEYAESQQFDDFQKVPYSNAEELFIKLIQNFKHSSNFKVPQSLIAKDLIRLHPKIYTRKTAQFMNKYLNQYSSISPLHQKQFKRSFKKMIKPEQYVHLPTYEYENGKELKQLLQRQESPCLIFIDLNSREQGLSKQYEQKHLFIMMFDLYDIWIDRNGYLIDSHQLSRQDLADKQGLFIQMFNNQVFETYNDMGYYYLSNSYKEVKKEVRKITFMTRQQLVLEHKRHPNLLMVIFVESTDRKWIPQQFYDAQADFSKDPRVKLIFIHSNYVINDHILYIKYNEIDPVIYHINRVQLGSRSNYCIFPDNRAGKIIWHKFAQKHKKYKPVQYTNLQQMDSIAQDIKGKFHKVCVICEKQDQKWITQVFDQYSIKTKQKTGQELFFINISESDIRSYMIPTSNIKQIQRSRINLNENYEDNEEKFQTAGHQIDVKVNSSNARYNSNSDIRGPNLTLQDVVESKNFIINLKQNLKDSFNVGNLYTKGVEHFKNYKSIDLNKPLNQIIVTNQNLNEVKSWVENNPKLFLVYVSDKQNLPQSKQGNTIVIKQNEIPKFIKKLQTIQRTQKVGQSGHSGHSTNNNTNLNIPYAATSHTSSNHTKALPTSANGDHGNIVLDNLPYKNLKDFKVVKIFYDQNLDHELKKQILLAALKNNNFRPYLFKDMDTLKKLMKQQGSLSLLLISKDPPNLQEEMQKQNYTVIKNKKGRKVIIPKNFNTGIEGLSTILQQEQNELDEINKQVLNENVDQYLKIMEKNPEKGRKNLLVKNQDQSQNKGQIQYHNNLPNQFLGQQDSDKLNLHSNIEAANIEAASNDVVNANKQWIRQRLDGGIMVLFVEESQAEKVQDLKRKYNLLLQQYSHSINLINSIRDKNDRFTMAVVEPNILPDVHKMKEQHPNTVFILLNPSDVELSEKDKQVISYEIQHIEQINQIVGQIYEANKRIRQEQLDKMHSKIGNKRTSFVDNGNSNRLSTGYNNTKFKNAFIFLKQNMNEGLANKLAHLHLTLVKYQDFSDAQKKFNSYSGHQLVLIANDNDIPLFEDYIQKKKEQTYVIRLNPPKDFKQNAKIRKNIIFTSFSEEQVANFLLQKFGQYTNIPERSHEKHKEGKSYAPKYMPNTFGTTPRFPSQQDYVPYKNDVAYSSRGKSISRDSKVLRTEGSQKSLASKNNISPYYNR